MRNTKRNATLIGAGLLGMSGIPGIAQPALAAPRAEVREERKDVKEARKNVREQRKDVRQADTNREVRQQNRQLTAAQLKLQRQQEQLRREQLQREQQRLQQQRIQQQRTRQGYRQPVYQDRPVYQNPSVYQNRDYKTIEGVVTNDLQGNTFILRKANDTTQRVQLRSGEPRRLSRGDTVRLYGFSTGNIFHAQNISITNNR